MRFSIWIFFIWVNFLGLSLKAQYAPQAGIAGSTAIHKDSNIIIDWAANCELTRGWLNITDTNLGKVSFGDALNANGNADGNLVSLGDAGFAIYYLENPIVNGPGFDFAVFENGFKDPLDSSMAYLELAKVSVSSDGLNYVVFGIDCLVDTITQIAGFGEYMNAIKLNNLAGKYIGQYGTPFDLQDLSSTPSIDLNNIRYIKIKDVIGTINPEFASRDKNGQIINDPFPTPFPTGGFDLDACAILHHKYPTLINPVPENDINFIYPNPSQGLFSIDSRFQVNVVKVFSSVGKLMLSQEGNHIDRLNLLSFPSGIYLVMLQTNQQKVFTRLIQKK